MSLEERCYRIAKESAEKAARRTIVSMKMRTLADAKRWMVTARERVAQLEKERFTQQVYRVLKKHDGLVFVPGRLIKLPWTQAQSLLKLKVVELFVEEEG